MHVVSTSFQMVSSARVYVAPFSITIRGCSARRSSSVAFWMPSTRDLCLGGEGLDATESGVAAAMKFVASNLGMVWWRTSEGISR
jgi:hypothetical protein